ncbi:MAG TPA: hypothetical protein GX707_00225, partial [Epulopiscium sp.]|nr:hypothetical protein [Candidatus Epulonipiscium sp.]
MTNIEKFKKDKQSARNRGVYKLLSLLIFLCSVFILFIALRIGIGKANSVFKKVEIITIDTIPKTEKKIVKSV